MNQYLNNSLDLAARVLLSILFLVAGFGKIGGYEATAGYMQAMGVWSGLLPLVIITEVVGAIAIIIGWQTRIVAFLLAGFTLLSALFFHTNFADQMQQILFMKNLAIAGGLLLLVRHGAGAWSIDARKHG
ncbi:DoxX family protein [Methylophaga lonarensis]|uniref:DoxX family protein n=1 Tax=Methylophaga lonarensis TaxID=999151 RepID=UPI003D2E515E